MHYAEGGVMTQGIVLRAADADVERKAAAARIAVTVMARGALPYTRNLVLEPGVRAPWERIQVGFALLERWDALCPLGKPGLLAADVGSPTERKYTEAVVRDLRLPMYEPRMLFVRNSEDGQALFDAYVDERGDQADRQLAFCRAVYQVKPRLCPLPQVWVLGTVPEARKDTRRRRPKRKRIKPLVRVQIGPGQFVQCHPGDEEKVREMYAARGRGGRR